MWRETEEASPDVERDDEEEGGGEELVLPPAQCLMLSNSSRIRLPVAEMLGSAVQVLCVACVHRRVCMCARHGWYT